MFHRNSRIYCNSVLFLAFILFSKVWAFHIPVEMLGSPQCIDMQMCNGPPYHPTCGAPLPICSLPPAQILEVPAEESTPSPDVAPTKEPISNVAPGASQPTTSTGTNPPENTNTQPVSPDTPTASTQPNTKPSPDTNGNVATGSTPSSESNSPSPNTNQPTGTNASPDSSNPATNPQPSSNTPDSNVNKPSTDNNPTSQSLPTTTSSQPPSDTNQPPSSTNQPPSNTNQPPSNTNQPPSNTNQPPSNTNQPPSSTNQPSSNTNQPPSSTNQPPSNTNQPPSNTNQPPSNTNQPSSNTNQPPSSTNQPPSNTNQPPSNTNQPPSNTNQPPPNTNPPTSNTNERPSDTNQPSQKPPSTNQPSSNANLPTNTNTPAGGNAGKPGVLANCGDMMKTCNDGKHVTVTVSIPVNGGNKPVASSGGLQRDASKTNSTKDFDFCPVTFKRKGCYKDKHDGNHPLPELLFTDRDSSSKVFSGTTIASKNWGSYIIKLICRCAETANQKRFSFFGIQHYGDCWSGMQSSINNYETQGISKACIARDQSSCEEEDMACVGENGANFVYQLTGGPGPEKKNKITRKKTKMKHGTRKRHRHVIKKHF